MLDVAPHHLYLAAQRFIDLDLIGNLFPGVQQSGVGFATEGRGDLHQRIIDHLFGQIHRDLTSKSDLFVARFSFDFRNPHLEYGSYAFQNLLDGNFLVRSVSLEHFTQNFLDYLFVQLG